MKKLLPLSLLALAPFMLAQSSLAQGGLDRIEKRWGDATKLLDDRRFEAEKRIDDRFSRLQERLKKGWLRVERTGVKEFVDYGEDGKSKTKIQFEKGTLTVEVIEDVAKENLLKEDILKRLKDQVRTTENAVDGTGVQVLKGQIDPAKEKAALAAPTRETYTAPDGSSKVKYTVEVPMKANHLNERAQQYVPLAKAVSARYGVPTDLILAVMECESTFNPYADNGIAFGLMQLVPTSGAFDAAGVVFGEKQKLPPHKLKNAEINANLGAALLMQYLTYDAYLGTHKNTPYKHQLLGTAAYNAGIGNALNFINKTPGAWNLPDQAFFNALYAYLPNETKHYIQKVPKAREQYKGL